MIDTDIVIVIQTERITVIYPERIGREYGRPWLAGWRDNGPGCREWNIDVFETLRQFNSGREFTHSGKFVVGKWGTEYETSIGVRRLIPMGSVIGFEDLPEVEKLQADAARQAEARAFELLAKKRRGITGQEFDDLADRVAALERHNKGRED